MELKIKQSILKFALQKIKLSLGSPTFIKLKATKDNLLLASEVAGYSTVAKIKNVKPLKEGIVTLDFESFFALLNTNSEIHIKSDDLNFSYTYGRCKGNIALLEEIKFEHKKLENLIELGSDALQINDFLNLVTLKDIKFKLDDAPISIELQKNHIGLYSATSLESVVLEKTIENKSKLEASLSPKVLKKIFDLVKPMKFKFSLSESTVYVECSDSTYEISFSAPLPESYVTSVDSIKSVMSDELDSCKNYVYLESDSLKAFFAKCKPIADTPSYVEALITKKGDLELNYSATKGRVTDTLSPYKSKCKTTKEYFKVDYELMLNNLQKLNGVIKLNFCKRTLWIESVNKDQKFNVMVALV